MKIVGLISDTHGLLRPEAVAALQGSETIIHAGDVGHPDVLEQLQSICPVVAVRGNVDTARWAENLPLWSVVRAGDLQIYIVHKIQDFSQAHAGQDIDIVVSGHSHRPSEQRTDGILYLNPGSAGPHRFRLPITVGLLEIDNKFAQFRLIEIAS